MQVGNFHVPFCFLFKQKEDTDYFAGHVICLLLQFKSQTQAEIKEALRNRNYRHHLKVVVTINTAPFLQNMLDWPDTNGYSISDPNLST